jgi:hypothetical protein
MHVSLLFAAQPASFASQKIIRCQARGLKQPTGKSLVMTQSGGLFPENNENRLRDFLGVMGIANLPERDGINQTDVPRHQSGKRFVRIASRKFLQQLGVLR